MFCKSISTAPLGGNEMPSTQIYPSVTVPASAAAQIATGPRRLIACILVSASANSAVKFKTSTGDSGTVLLSLASLANSSTGVDLSALGGMQFSTGIYCKPSGTGAVVYAWYE